MSEPENFLTRWSQRKLAKGEQTAAQRDEQPAQIENKTEAAAPAPQDVAATGPEDKPIDTTSLPPIESIDASTDVTAFLRPGVPPELSRAALRRAWSADPAIRDFVGLVENGCDFNDPNAMPGFGPIDPAEVARLAAQMLGELPGQAEAALETAQNAALDRDGPPASIAAEPRTSDRSSAAGETGPAKPSEEQHSAANVAPQKESGA
jgi:hypothetical protein